MKKYLMSGVAAIAFLAAFTSCSKSTDLYEEGRKEKDQQAQNEQKVLKNYDQVFEETFGKPAANQDWGLSDYGTHRNSTSAFSRAFTRTNSGQNYPATSGHINANGNQWAAVESNITQYGGWDVPDPLTEGQKLRVKAYFQANPNLEYNDPEWRHFFVQQVYKGGDSPKEGGSPENIVAKSGATFTSGNMGELYVGPNKDENFKINDFGKGTAKTYPNVLNNHADINNGDTHPDEIMLMVNIDNTSTFSYTNTATGEYAYNNKCALVSAAEIDRWAESNGNIGESVTDIWNRSFLGFDLALWEGEQAYATENGSIKYASYQQCAESPNFAWDGEKIIDISSDKTIKKSNGNPIGYIINAPGWYTAEDQINISNQTSQGFTPETANTCETPVIKDFTYEGTKYQSVVNLRYLRSLADDGYLPTDQYGLTTWVKVGKSDGYFSDWIVTLTKAERFDPKYEGRVFAEDLSVEDESDFDFNDVVFDWGVSSDLKTMYVKLLAAGGTLPLTIGTSDEDAVEVHQQFGVSETTMVNTGVGGNGITKEPVELTFTTNGSFSGAADIIIKVDKGNAGILTLSANQGMAASKLYVRQGTKWVDEYVNIERAYPGFTSWVQGGSTPNWKKPVSKYVDLNLSNNN